MKHGCEFVRAVFKQKKECSTSLSFHNTYIQSYTILSFTFHDGLYSRRYWKEGWEGHYLGDRHKLEWLIPVFRATDFKELTAKGSSTNFWLG